ncbi:hypothetical protein CMI37_29255 [Candidatus Pacearchaeota archaeon]|nr:hypothetical protein [Candidatus Pacearchaeota archaeon]|tara:strand:- start:3396 stop:3707 length:312 start_codon:yes stop_codon:yes gene_type:complete
MSRLSRLVGKPVDIVVEGESFTIKPLKMKQLDLLMDIGSENIHKQAEGLKKLIKKTILDCVPDATDEEIDNISLRHFQAFSDAIMKVNGLENAAQPKNKQIKG